MLERITEEFFQTGMNFEEFVNTGKEDEQKRMLLYFNRSEKEFKPKEFHIDLKYPINLLVAATTWCWDSQTNVPILARIAEHSPNINLKIFNKDQYPFLIDRVNGGEKVPQVLIFSKDFYFLARWVERPTLTYRLYAEIHQEIGWDESTKDEFVKEYRKRFLKNHKELENALIHEIRTLLERTEAIQSSTSRFFQ